MEEIDEWEEHRVGEATTDNKIIKWILLIGFLIIATITNPTKEDFKSYLRDQYSNQHENSFLGLLMEQGIFDTIIESHTKEKDFVFFTVYVIEVDGESNAFIGGFNNLLRIK